MGEVEDTEFLFETAGCDDLGVVLLREGDGFDDVVVWEGVEAFAGLRVPDLASEWLISVGVLGNKVF